MALAATAVGSSCVNTFDVGNEMHREQPPALGGVSRKPCVSFARRGSTGELLWPPLLCFTVCRCPGLSLSPPRQAHAGFQPSPGCLPRPRIAPAAHPCPSCPCSTLLHRTRSLRPAAPRGARWPSLNVTDALFFSFFSFPLTAVVPFMKLPSCDGWIFPLPSQRTPAGLSSQAAQQCPRRSAVWAYCCHAGFN